HLRRADAEVDETGVLRGGGQVDVLRRVVAEPEAVGPAQPAEELAGAGQHVRRSQPAVDTERAVVPRPGKVRRVADQQEAVRFLDHAAGRLTHEVADGLGQVEVAGQQQLWISR